MSGQKKPRQVSPLIGYPGEVAARLIGRIERGQRVAPAVRKIAESWAGGRIVADKARERPDAADRAANDTTVGDVDKRADDGMVWL